VTSKCHQNRNTNSILDLFSHLLLFCINLFILFISKEELHYYLVLSSGGRWGQRSGVSCSLICVVWYHYKSLKTSLKCKREYANAINPIKIAHIIARINSYEELSGINNILTYLKIWPKFGGWFLVVNVRNVVCHCYRSNGTVVTARWTTGCHGYCTEVS